MSALASSSSEREVWLAQRRQGIGGSEAAAIVGLHPWTSAYSLYLDKRGEWSADQEQTEPMFWGLALEPVVARVWEERVGADLGLSLVRFEPYSEAARRVHPELPWMYASLDGVVLATTDKPNGERWTGREVGGFECKTANGWMADDWDDGPPPYVVVQCQHQMAVTGHPRTYGAVLLGGQQFRPWIVERDDEVIGSLIEAERVFWQRVIDGRPPKADGHQSTTDTLKARWSESIDNAVELGEEGLLLVQRCLRAKAAFKAAEEEKAAAENGLRDLLGENEVGTVFGEVACTWRTDKRGVRRLIPSKRLGVED